MSGLERQGEPLAAPAGTDSTGPDGGNTNGLEAESQGHRPNGKPRLVREAELAPLRPEIIWREGEPFTRASEVIAGVLGRPAKTFCHRLFGAGVGYKIGTASRAEVFASRLPAILRVRLADAHGEDQARQYKLDRLTVRRTEAGDAFLSFTCERDGGCSTVDIFPDGEIEERHHPNGMPAESSARVRRDRPPSEERRMYTVAEAAAIIGCSAHNVNQLLRKTRLPGRKVGREWLVDADAVHGYRRTMRGPRPERPSSNG